MIPRLCLLASVSLSLFANADPLSLDPAITDHLVFQRGAPLVIAGTGPAEKEVRVSLGDLEAKVTSNAEGSWQLEFPAQKAGGPFSLKASCDGETVAREDLLCGDVWVFSGQSNMQMGLDEAVGGPEEMAGAGGRTRWHLLTMPKAGAEQPESHPGAEWKPADPESARKFSAVAWFTAKHLSENPKLRDVPLGLIDSSFGGTAIEAWIPAAALPDLDEEEISASMFGIAPAHLYNRMIAPLASRPVKGVVWYQGEANAGKPAAYRRLLPALMQGWRDSWHDGELPFFIVQLPAFEGTMGGLDFSWLREAQAESCAKTPSAWLAMSYDTTDGSDLHPVEKEEIGRRVALLARKNVYGEAVVATGPRLTSWVKDETEILTFDQSLEENWDVHGFELAGEDGEFFLAKAVAQGRHVTVFSRRVPDPVHVRYAWGPVPAGDLKNEEGLPAAPFRSDEFAPDFLVFQPLATPYGITCGDYALASGQGSVDSLIFRGRQFLSNEPGGGTGVPGFFGPRKFPRQTVLGPRRLQLADHQGSLEVACDAGKMTWVLANSAGEDFDFQISLHPSVKVANEDGRTVLSREDSRVIVDGVTRTGDGKLIITVPAAGEARLVWEFQD